MLEWVVTSAALCALVIALRYLLRGKIGLRLQYALWGLVLLRLLLPVSFGSSSLSLMNALPGEEALLTTAPTAAPRPASEAAAPLPAVTPVPASPGTLAPKPEGEARPAPLVPETASPAAVPERTPPEAGRILRLLWTAGTVALLLWFAGVNLRFARKLRRSRVRFSGAEDFPLPVYVTPAAETPCLFGLFRPAAYLPPEAAEDPSLGHILAHELTHFRHGDQVWSLLRSLALALHWFDPLVWWAAFLSRRDGELACDEGTLRRLGEAERGAYGRTLLRVTCASRPALFRAATTMNGSKAGLKERIRLIAGKPRTAVVTLVGVILVAALALGCTFTGAKKPVEYDEEWFAETAWPYAEEYARANSLPIAKDNCHVLQVNAREAEVYYPVENATEVLAVSFVRNLNGTWAVVKENPVRNIPRDRGFVIQVDVPDWPGERVETAVGYLTQLVSGWNDGYLPGSGEQTETVNRIKKARLTGLTPLGAGTQGLTEGRELYRLEYRLLPEDQEHILLPAGMRTEVIDGETWITEWSENGQPCLLLAWRDPDGDPEGEPVWFLAGETNTRELEEVYGTPEMLEKYGDACTAAAAELYAACLAGDNAPSVRLNREDFTLTEPGQTYKMTVEIPPALRGAVVSWFSLDPNVATVSGDGLVTAVNHGTTEIEVWVGMARARCTVRVIGYAAGSPVDREVEISFEPRDVPEGIELLAKIYVSRIIDTWNGTLPQGDGVLKANSNPIVSARITGVSPVWKGRGGQGENRALYLLEYRLLPEDQEKIALAEGMRAEYADGKTWITEWGEDGQPYLLIFSAGPEGDPEILYGGPYACFTSTKELESYDTPELLEKYGEAYAAAAEELYAAKSAEAMGRAISLQWADVTLRAGESVPLLAAAPSGETVIWTSEDPAVATVSEDGTVTAVGRGVTKITASVGEETAVCTVRVMQAPPDPQGETGEEDAGITLSYRKIILYAGGRCVLTAALSPALAGADVTWSSEDPSVAAVSPEGLVTAVGPGNALIIASAGDSRADCMISVPDGPVRMAAEGDGYPRNDRGETYGPIRIGDDGSFEIYPDLQLTQGQSPEGDPIQGYVRTFDVDNGCPLGNPRNPEEAIAYMDALEALRREALRAGREYLWTIPLYEADGVTVIGSFGVGNAARSGEEQPAAPEDPARWLEELGDNDFPVSAAGSYAETGRLWAETFAARYTRLSPENPLYSRRTAVRQCDLEAETLLSDPKELAFHLVVSFDAPDPEGFTRCYEGTVGPRGEAESDPAYAEWETMEIFVILRELPGGGWVCREIGSGGGYGWGWLYRNEAACAWIMDYELDLLLRGEAWSPESLLSVLPLEDWSTFEQRHGAYALEALIWALEEGCLTASNSGQSEEDLIRRLQTYPEDQSYRDLYVMLGAMNASGGIAGELGRILAVQRLADPERFEACLGLLKPEDRTRILGLAEAALTLRPEEAAVLETLTALETERVDTVVCRVFAGTGSGISFTLSRGDYGKEIKGLLDMLPRDIREYEPLAVTPERFGQMTDFSLTLLDARGEELLTVYASSMQMIRIGSCIFRCREPFDTQAFNLALAAARNAGILQYPGEA